MITMKNSERERERPLKALSSLGFTIVELLIVIVIIGILAAIVIVAYNGITKSAKEASAISELKQWHKLYQIYKAQYGEYPDPDVAGGGPSNDRWCLGTGFPNGFCVNISGGTWGVAESTGANIMSELAKVGTPPRNSSKWVVDYNVGPFLLGSRLETIIESSDGCPGGTQAGQYVSTTNRQHCYIQLD